MGKKIRLSLCSVGFEPLIKTLLSEGMTEKLANSIAVNRAEKLLRENEEIEITFPSEMTGKQTFERCITLSEDKHPNLINLYNEADKGCKSLLLAAVMNMAVQSGGGRVYTVARSAAVDTVAHEPATTIQQVAKASISEPVEKPKETVNKDQEKIDTESGGEMDDDYLAALDASGASDYFMMD